MSHYGDLEVDAMPPFLRRRFDIHMEHVAELDTPEKVALVLARYQTQLETAEEENLDLQSETRDLMLEIDTLQNDVAEALAGPSGPKAVIESIAASRMTVLVIPGPHNATWATRFAAGDRIEFAEVQP